MVKRTLGLWMFAILGGTCVLGLRARAEDEGPVDQSQFLPPATAPAPTSAPVPSSPVPSSPAPEVAAAAPSESFLEELLTIRDPFRRMINVESDVNVKLLSELEQYPVEEFKLVGVMTGPKKMRAMLRAPSGSTHFVAMNQKIGTRKGRVKKITPDFIEVLETSVNILGQDEVSTARIDLAPEFQQ